MDPITHLLLAYCLIFWLQKIWKIPTKFVIPYLIGSVIPDLDYIFNFVTYYMPKLYWLEHRAMGHSIIGVIPFVLAVGAIFTIPKVNSFLWSNEKYADVKIWSWYGLLALYLGSLVHLLADFFVPTGMMLFFPFSFRWYGVKLLSTNNIHTIAALAAVVTFWPLKWNKRRRNIVLSLFMLIFTFYSSARVAVNIRAANLFEDKYGPGDYSSNELIYPYNINYNVYDSTNPLNKTYIVATIDGIQNKFVIEDFIPEIKFLSSTLNESLAFQLINKTKMHGHYYRLWQKNRLLCSEVSQPTNSTWRIRWFAPIRDAEVRAKIGPFDYGSSTELIFYMQNDGTIFEIERPFST